MSRIPRSAVVGILGLPPKYGGFETLVDFLVKNLQGKLEFTVYCSAPSYAEKPDTYHGARLRYLNLRANGIQSIFYDIVSLADSCFRRGSILVLGVSGGIFFPFVRLMGKRIVLNIGGLDWQRAKWSPLAQRFLKFSEAVAVKSATVLVADNAGIADYLRSEYSRDSILIEYGGDHNSPGEITEARRKAYPFLGSPYAIAVARIQQDNNVEMILNAFAQQKERMLVFVGNWNNSDFGKDLKARFSQYEHIYLLDAIYDLDELNTLRANCSLYIHGHSAGGTAPSLVEAMYLSLPVAAYDVNYNRATTEDAARYFSNSEQLLHLLSSVPGHVWLQQRTVMKEIADRRYCWNIIAEKYLRVLCWSTAANG